MQTAELIRVLLFLLAIAIVYTVAAWVVVRLLIRRFLRREPISRREWLTSALAFGVAVAGALCFAYGYFVEPYWPEVSRVGLVSPKLAGASRPIRLVHISDLHCDPKVRLEEKLPDLIAAERPDLIVFTGDSINSPAGLPVLKRCLTRLAGLAPTFAVRGNWDVNFWSEMDLFGGTGARELKGEAVKVDVAGMSLWITGAPAGGEFQNAETLEAIPAGAFSVFLYHYPDEIEAIARRKIDLYCAGHTHGGQVALPFYGALVTFSRFGKKYESRLHRVGETWLYVNRGIGMEGGDAPRVRFCARPEVTVFKLSAGRP
ncbi:MAG TPA: metallophosphoesterase [Blastocatellia bacterium]|nr:metallophosphoesterase [Blastocatellia bacterium]